MQGRKCSTDTFGLNIKKPGRLLKSLYSNSNAGMFKESLTALMLLRMLCVLPTLCRGNTELQEHYGGHSYSAFV